MSSRDVDPVAPHVAFIFLKGGQLSLRHLMFLNGPGDVDHVALHVSRAFVNCGLSGTLFFFHVSLRF